MQSLIENLFDVVVSEALVNLPGKPRSPPRCQSARYGAADRVVRNSGGG